MLLVPTAAAISLLAPLVFQQTYDYSLLSSAFGLGKASQFTKQDLSSFEEAFSEFSNATEQHPWKNQRLKCGEDSFFIAEDSVGVADGVGGWTEYGVDPSKISNQLMQNCLEEAAKVKDPKKVLSDAYYKILKEKQVDAGSTTAIVAQLCPKQEDNNENIKKKNKNKKKKKKNQKARKPQQKAATKNRDQLCIANLGDSSCVVLRKKEGEFKVVFRSKEQQHYFNCPFQLAVVPKGDFSSSIQDTPEKAAKYSVPIEEHDLIILGTDGLFDNLFIEEIKKIVEDSAKEFEKFMKSNSSDKANDNEKLQQRNFWIAKKLVSAARIKGEDEKCSTPFALNAVAHRKFFNGGKLDDITVVCSSVVEKN